MSQDLEIGVDIGEEEKLIRDSSHLIRDSCDISIQQATSMIDALGS